MSLKYGPFPRRPDASLAARIQSLEAALPSAAHITALEASLGAMLEAGEAALGAVAQILPVPASGAVGGGGGLAEGAASPLPLSTSGLEGLLARVTALDTSG